MTQTCKPRRKARVNLARGVSWVLAACITFVVVFIATFAALMRWA